MTESGFGYQRTKKLYPALKTIFGFVTHIFLSSCHLQYTPHGQVGNVCLYCAKGHGLGSHHFSFGFSNRGV